MEPGHSFLRTLDMTLWWFHEHLFMDVGKIGKLVQK
jgi:hypothetical protein